MTTSSDEQLRETLRPVVATVDPEDGHKVIAARLHRTRVLRAVGGVAVVALIVGVLVAAPWHGRSGGDNRVSVATKRLPSAPPVEALSAAAQASGLPGARDQTGMAYDERHHQVVLFAGQHVRGTGDLADTWLFDRHGWRQVHPRTSPPGRFAASIAYDARSRTTVLHGGFHHVDRSGDVLALTDTWTWDGSTWHERHPQHVPPWSPQAPLAFDLTTRALTMLAPPPGYPGSDPQHGVFNSGVLGSASRFDRWVWDRDDWHVVHDRTSPPISFGVYAWDAPTRQMVYFDYQPPVHSCPSHNCTYPDPTGTRYSTTWTFDGNGWTHRKTTAAPRSSVLAFSMPTRRAATVVDGSRVWAWHNNDWTVIQQGVPTESEAAATVDDDAGVVIVFGAFDSPNMWIGNSNGWTTVRPRPTTNGSSFDLLGGVPHTIVIDHLGYYVWTSSIVVPHLPDKWATTFRPVGIDARPLVKDTLVAVPGGYSLQVSFTVESFAPGAALIVTASKAEGTPHPIIPGSGTG